MNTGTGIIGGEVAVEAGIDMIVTGTAARKEIIVAEAGAAVPVLIVTKTMGEANMMKSAAVGADLTKGIKNFFCLFLFSSLIACLNMLSY